MWKVLAIILLVGVIAEGHKIGGAVQIPMVSVALAHNGTMTRVIAS